MWWIKIENVPSCRSSTVALQEQKEGEQELGIDVEAASGRLEEIDAELTSIMEQLGEAKVNVIVCMYYNR